MFDLTLQVLGLVVNGTEDNVEVQLIIGFPLPFSPAGKPVMIPAGVLRFFLGRDEALKAGLEITENGQNVKEAPKESDLTVVTNPNDIANITNAK